MSLGDKLVLVDDRAFNLLITTRAENERLRKALEAIEGKSHTNSILDNMGIVLTAKDAVEMVNIARHALEKGE